MLRLFGIIVFVINGCLAITGSGEKCNSDSDCVIYNKRIMGWQASVPQPVGFLCIKGQCQPVGTASEVCSKSSDCAVYQFIQNELAKERAPSSFLPAKYVQNVTAYLDSLCAPQYCTIASNCDQTIDVFSLNDQPRLPHTGNYSCCGGAEEHWQCNQLGGFLDTCNQDYKCVPYNGKEDDQPPADSELPRKEVNLQYCSVESAGKDGQWIGIVMALLGSTLLNVGLNVQKLALRKRHEKKRESDRMQILVVLQAIRDKILAQRAESAATGTRARTSSRKSFLGLWYGADKSSSSNDIEMTNLMSNRADSDGGSMTVIGAESLNRNSDRPSSRIQSWFSMFGNDSQNHSSVTSAEQMSRPVPLSPPSPPSPVQATQNSHNVDSTASTNALIPLNSIGWKGGSVPQPSPRPPRVDADLQSIEFPEAPGDNIQFEKNLGLGRLLLNPVWLLGFTLFAIGNFLNFIALKFAPQSLVAPLGAWALVINVIIAPMINRESWGIKDIIGVVFIVAGSAMVVVFAGVSGKDYNLCVLLRLFGRPATIIFLTVTSVLITFIFFLLCTIEKNLDIDESDIESDHEAEVDLTPVLDSEMDERSREDPRRRRSEDTKSFRSQYNAREIVRQALAASAQNNRLDRNQYFQHSMTVDSPVSMSARSDPFGQYRRHSEPNIDTASFSKPSTSDPSVSQPSNSQRQRLGSTHKEEFTSPDEFQNIPRSHSHTNITVSLSSSPTMSLSSEDIFDLQDSTSRPLEQSYTVARPNVVVLPLVPTPVVATGSTQAYSASGLPLPSITDGPLTEYFNQTDGVASLPGSRPTSRPMRMRSVAQALRTELNLPKDDKRTKTQRFFLRIWRMVPFPIRRFIKEVKDWFVRQGYVPTLKNKIPLHSAAVLYILPLSYASLGGLMATITVLFAKSTIHLLSESLFENNNQYDNVISWVITLVTVTTSVLQIYWINMGLQRYDALLQIPIFYVVWTVFDVIGGGIYFDEFSGFTAMQYFLFCLGVAVIFVGVGVLATRLKSIQESDTTQPHAVPPSEMTHVTTDIEPDTTVRRPESL